MMWPLISGKTLAPRYGHVLGIVRTPDANDNEEVLGTRRCQFGFFARTAATVEIGA